MSDLGHEPPIIRIVKKINHAGHHGGAWKVAFADFMTAMMALFIVLWILNQSEDVKRGVGGYFRDPMGKAAMGRGQAESQGNATVLGPKMIATPEVFKRMAASQADLEAQADKLKQMMKEEEGLADLGDQISIEVTKEGIRIEIADNDEGTIFDLGSSNLKAPLIRALEILGKEYAKLPAPVVIEGHTDSTPYGSESGMSNWELSTQRANEARKVLEGAGLQSEKIFMIRGYADRRPISDNSSEARNRRISMLLLSSQGLEMSFGTMDVHEAKAPYSNSDADSAFRAYHSRHSGETVMNSCPTRVLYILHEDEHEPPRVLRDAAEVVMIHAGGTPDLSVLDEPPHLIVMGAPLDEEMLHELHTVEALYLPIIGLGTGPAEHLTAHVSESICAEDMRVVLDLAREHAEIWSLDANSGEHPLVAKLLESFTDHVTRMLEHLLALRVPEYRKRTGRVIEACEWIASHVGLSDQELRPLLYAASFREIGKMGLPDRILFSTRSSRAPEEQRLYNRYPEMGAKVIAELPNLLDSAQMLKYLLENYDGSGPEGLQSSQIPLASRILRVVSAYEMIAEDLPENASTEEIMEVMSNGQGSLYDPLLLRLVQNYHTLTGGEEGNQSRSKLIRLADVVEGMILAEDIWSRTGVKIMPRGTRITEHTLDLLQSGSIDATLESVEIQTCEEVQ